MIVWAVDPGDKHVGVAEFEVGVDADGDQTADCTKAWELDPEGAIDLIAAGLLHYRFDVLVVEEFRLYKDKALAQTGSTMPTCELIGQIKWAHRLDCRRRRDLVQEIASFTDGRKGSALYRGRQGQIARNAAVDLVLQPASIQEPTAGLLRRRGIKSLAKQRRRDIVAAGGEGDHALSAELHGWHYLFRPTTNQHRAGA